MFNRKIVSLPAAVSFALAIGAVYADDVCADFSSKGDAVDLGAPGLGLYSAFPGGSYMRMSGTSQAAPVVCGIIALLKEAYPNATVDDIEFALFTSTRPLGAPGHDPEFGWGRVDAFHSVIGQVFAPRITIAISEQWLSVSWPAAALGFGLEETGGVESLSIWRPVSTAPVPMGERNIVTLSRNNVAGLFRLKRPLLAPNLP